ncbi:unnamed protein product [Dicrocoelium dendriticum]|nr:unnamed protein product [Dicrocoelium dendriticum]
MPHGQHARKLASLHSDCYVTANGRWRNIALSYYLGTHSTKLGIMFRGMTFTLFTWRLFVLFIFLQPYAVHALIPIDCAENVTRSDQVCCPRNPQNGLVCGGPRRGYCQRIHAPQENVPNVFWVDDRLAWPTRFVQYACQCQPRMFGVSCEQCWFGWTGSDCTRREKKIRRDIRTYSNKELEVFKDVVARSWTWPSNFLILDESKNQYSDPIQRPRFLRASMQYYITFVHCYSARGTLYDTKEQCNEYSILNFNHDGVTFPTWHRYNSLIWERLLGEIAWQVHRVKDFTIPYWDWVGLEKCDICTNQYLGAPGEVDKFGTRVHSRSPFHNLTDYCWELVPEAICSGCQKWGKAGKLTRRFHTELFPTQKDIEFALSLRNYFVLGERDSNTCRSFHMALEGFCGPPGTAPTGLWTHNKVHNMIQGSMQSTATATNDPLFILHHATVDKIFSMWYRRYSPSLTEYPNEGVRPGHKRDAFMIGFFPLVRNGEMFVDVTELGYDYDRPESVGNYANNGEPPVFQ